MGQAGWLILGAFLAVAGGVLLEHYKSHLQQVRLRKLVTGLLKDEIDTIVGILTSLESECRTLGFFPISRIRELGSARPGFDRNRDLIILFKDESLRREIFDFYRNLGTHAAAAETVEQVQALPSLPAGTNLPNWRQSVRQDIANLIPQGRTLRARLDTVKK